MKSKKEKLDKDFGEEIFPGCWVCDDPRDAGYLSEEELRRMHLPEDIIKILLEVEKKRSEDNNNG